MQEDKTEEQASEDLYDWEEVTDDDGQTFYYSPSRNESRWDMPVQEEKKTEAGGNIWDNKEYVAHFQQEIEKSGKWVYAPLEVPSVPGKRVYFYTASNGQVVRVEL